MDVAVFVLEVHQVETLSNEPTLSSPFQHYEPSLKLIQLDQLVEKENLKNESQKDQITLSQKAAEIFSVKTKITRFKSAKRDFRKQCFTEMARFSNLYSFQLDSHTDNQKK